MLRSKEKEYLFKYNTNYCRINFVYNICISKLNVILRCKIKIILLNISCSEVGFFKDIIIYDFNKNSGTLEALLAGQILDYNNIKYKVLQINNRVIKVKDIDNNKIKYFYDINYMKNSCNNKYEI